MAGSRARRPRRASRIKGHTARCTPRFFCMKRFAVSRFSVSRLPCWPVASTCARGGCFAQAVQWQRGRAVDRAASAGNAAPAIDVPVQGPKGETFTCRVSEGERGVCLRRRSAPGRWSCDPSRPTPAPRRLGRIKKRQRGRDARNQPAAAPRRFAGERGRRYLVHATARLPLDGDTAWKDA